MANNVTLAFPPAFCQQFFDRNGKPLSGGRLYTFVAGTRTSIVTYKTIGSTSSANRNTNPIVLDSAGYANLVLEVGKSYRLVLTDRFGFVIKEWDNVTAASGEGGGGGTEYTAVQGVKVNGTELPKDGNNVVDVPVPTASTATPLKDGTASAGSSSQWARGDHVHPTDDSREAVSNKVQSIDPTSTTEYGSSKAVADFVNSSVATNTANFLGTIAESSLGLDYTATNEQIALALNVHSWERTPTNNDYCFVSMNDPQTTDVDEYRRFKFNGSVWAYEYTLNNSSFTQAQWDAINSGLTSSDRTAYNAAVMLLNAHVADGSIHVTSSEKKAWNGKYTKPSTGIPKTDLASDVQTSLGKADTALQSHQSVTDNNPTLSWSSTSTVGTVGSTNLRVTMPSNPASGKADNTPTFTEATTRANLSGSGETMPTILGKVKKWFTDLKALAFKDTIGTADIADDAITAAKVKDNETLPVNVSGTAEHLSAFGRYDTWNASYDSDKPYVILADVLLNISSNTGAGQLFQLEFANDTIVRFRLEFSIKGGVVNTASVSVLYSTLSESELPNRLAVTYFKHDNDTKMAIRIYFRFTGHWEVVTLRQLDAQTGDEGITNWQKAIFYTGRGSDIASTVGTVVQLKYVLLVSDSIYAAKIGSRHSHPQIGSPATPVFVDSNGQVQPCMPSSMSVGHASALTPGGNAGQVLMSNGSGTDPSWVDIAFAQTKHSNRNTVGGASVVPYNTSTDNFAITINYNKANSRAFIEVGNYTVGRQLYVSLGHSSNLTPVAYHDNATITSTLSEYYLCDLDILCMGTGNDMPVYSFTIAIQVNENFCQYTIYDKMMYHI